MRYFISGLVLFAVCVSCLMFGDTAYAANNNGWFDGNIEQSTTRNADISSRGQCSGRTSVMYNYARNSFDIPGSLCVSHTPWGSLANNGYISIGTLNNYYKMDLPASMGVLFSLSKDRIYFYNQTSTGYFRVGYITNPSGLLSFNSITHKYTLPEIVSYVPGLYSKVGFSNDTQYLVGLDDSNALRRVSLTDFSTASVLFSSFGAQVSPKVITISNDGSIVAMASYSKSVVYDFDGCYRLSGTWCQYRVLDSSLDNLGYGLESIYIADSKEEVVVFALSYGFNVAKRNYSLRIPSRDVSYVALGDSYSSGEGTWYYREGTDGNEQYPDEKCHQAEGSSYPGAYSFMYGYRNEAGSRGMNVTRFIPSACSGATTEDIWVNNVSLRKQYDGNFSQLKISLEDQRVNAVQNQTPGRALQRDFLVYYHPTIATIGVGGNDVGFGGTLAACAGSFGTCAQASSKLAESGKLIQGKFNVLVETFEDLHAASPSTRLYAVGYPLFVDGDSWLCGLNTSLNQAERVFVRESIRYLNTVIEAAAKKAGIGYIDVEDSLGNSALCGGGASGVNGISLGNDIEIPHTGIKAIAQESFHPNADGYHLVAESIATQYGELDTYSSTNCPTVENGYCPNTSIAAPSIPSYFGASSRAVVDSKTMAKPTLKQQLVGISLGSLRSFSFLKIIVHSEQQLVGEYRVGSNGEFNQEITLPSSLEPGYHTLYVSGELASGELFEYQQVVLYLPSYTKTGPCGILPYASIDQDEDGIDDACDPYIDVESPMTVADPSTILIYPNQANLAKVETKQPTTTAQGAKESEAMPSSDDANSSPTTDQKGISTQQQQPSDAAMSESEQKKEDQSINDVDLVVGQVVAVVTLGVVLSVLGARFRKIL